MPDSFDRVGHDAGHEDLAQCLYNGIGSLWPVDMFIAQHTHMPRLHSVGRLVPVAATKIVKDIGEPVHGGVFVDMPRQEMRSARDERTFNKTAAPINLRTFGCPEVTA